MKFITRLITLLIIISLATNMSLAAQITLNIGESKDVDGNSVKLKSLKTDKAVVSVNGDSQILTEGEEEEIGSLKVTLTEIFYAGGEGNVKLEVTSLYVCGDGDCDPTESKETCCKDCGCTPGLSCINDKCQVYEEPECNKDEDCNDNNPDTLDKCINNKCNNFLSLICEEDSDCDDNDICTLDLCINNDCVNQQEEGCISGEEGDVVSIDVEDPNKDTTQEPGLKSEEKKSFLQRIIDFFRNLF